jgi:hypothetical protein
MADRRRVSRSWPRPQSGRGKLQRGIQSLARKDWIARLRGR